MGKIVFENIKKSKFFKPFDLIVYFVIIIFVLGLFFIFVIFPNTKTPSGFKVIINNDTVLLFDYDKGVEKIDYGKNYSTLTEVNQNDNIIEIKIFIDENKQDYNLLQVDLDKKSVKMIDANCSNTEDCTHFPPLTKDSGSIVCVPHRLSILPLNNERDVSIG